MSPERLQQIKGVDAKRTQGEWREGRHDMSSYDAYTGEGPYKNVYADDERGGVHEPTGEQLPFTVARGEGESHSECVANAAFIALASTAIPELVAEVERLVGEANDTVREKDESIEDLEAEVERLTDALALGRKAASDATYDRESELAAMARKVRDLEAENARLREVVDAYQHDRPFNAVCEAHERGEDVPCYFRKLADGPPDGGGA